MGAAVAAKFSKEGWKCAIASRSLESGQSPEGYMTLRLDAGDPRNVKIAFNAVREKLGPPRCVVYNGERLSLSAKHHPRDRPF